MKLSSPLVMLALLGWLSTLKAALDPLEMTAKSMVPRGEVVQKTAREYMVKTKAGTKIKLEFEINGKFQEASGLNLNKGDDFEPGMGLISLSSAAQRLVRGGPTIQGEWNLEKDSTHGWVYALSGESSEKTIYHLVNASSGDFIGTLPELLAEQKIRRPTLAIKP